MSELDNLIQYQREMGLDGETYSDTGSFYELVDAIGSFMNEYGYGVGWDTGAIEIRHPLTGALQARFENIGIPKEGDE